MPHRARVHRVKMAAPIGAFVTLACWPYSLCKEETARAILRRHHDNAASIAFGVLTNPTTVLADCPFCIEPDR